MTSWRPSQRTRSWVALLLPPITWFIFQQGLSALLHAQCDQAMAGVAWGLISLAACGTAIRLAGPLRQGAEPLAAPWLARLAVPAALIFSLAIIFQILALTLVPPCLA